MYISCWLYFLLFVITNDINHFFRCLLHLGSLSEKCQLCPLLIFPYHSSSFYYWLFKSYLYILNVILFLPSLNFYFEIFQTNTIIIIEFPTVDTVPHLLYLSFFLWCKHAAVCVLSRVWLLCDPMDCSLPGLSVQGISQARILEWAAISYSRGFSPPRDLTHLSCVSCIGTWIFFYHCTTWKAHKNRYRYINIFCWNIWK